MGGDGPGRRAARGRGRLSLLRFLGLDAEPVSYAVADPFGAVVARLNAVAPRVLPEDAWRAGARVDPPGGGGGMPSAFVRVTEGGGGTRVEGELRPARWAQVAWTLWLVALAGAALVSARSWVTAAVVLAVGAVGLPIMMRGGRARRAAVRDWLEKTVTGSR